MNYLSFDIGTTRCKCQLFSGRGKILKELSAEYGFMEKSGETYVDIRGIWKHMQEMISAVTKNYIVDSICISSFGESFVLLGKNDEILFEPMLYTDPRGKEEAVEIANRFGCERLYNLTGVMPQSMYSISKLLWIKKHIPSVYSKTDKILLICDYLGYLLSGKRKIDYGLASRTGVFNISTLQFDNEILSELGIPASLFSSPAPTGSVVGRVRKEITELGLKSDCTVVLGSHDQICTALGAGALKEGDAVDGMGTVECITPLFSQKPTDIEMGKQGYVCVPYAVKGLYCTYMFNYSCGLLVNWFRKNMLHDYCGTESSFYEYIEQDIKDSPTELLILPYFAGAATPYQNIGAKGGILNLTAQTKDCEIYRAIMESTAMEMRLNMHTVSSYGISIKRAVATGGGANSIKWLQIKADIQNIPIRTLRSSEGGLCGCAMLQAVAMGKAKDLEAAAKIFVKYKDCYKPQTSTYESYENNYKKYKKLYHTLKEFF